jgi:hypothetical protein
MIWENVEFFNFEEAKSIEGRKGLLLQRIPDYVMEEVNEIAKLKYRRPAGGEIRFVSANAPINVTLASYVEKSRACIYYGDFQAEEYIISEEPVVIPINPPKYELDNNCIHRKELAFSPSVRRIVLDGGEVHFIKISGEGIRPPTKNETPEKKFLAYGTSITQGKFSTTPMLSYVKATAWKLKADVLNYGCGASAMCDTILAEYFANRHDCDFATFCLSVNMLMTGVSLDTFYEKARYMVYKFAANNPGKPVICIGLFPFHLDIGLTREGYSPKAEPDEYRQALKTIVDESGLKNLYYIDGRALMPDFRGLSYDLIHPGNYGMTQIADNLYSFIKPLLQ